MVMLKETRFLPEPVLSEKTRFLASLGMTLSEGFEMTLKTLYCNSLLRGNDGLSIELVNSLFLPVFFTPVKARDLCEE